MLWLTEQPRDLTGRSVATGRALLAAGALAAVLLSGCGTPTTPPDEGNGSSGPTPGAATSPAATAPARSVTANNLLTVDDVPLDPYATEVVEAPDGAGRSVQESYICLPADGLSSLGATALVTRDFAYTITDPDAYPGSPLKNKPSVYTQALQFPDEAAATRARNTYAGWIKNCPKTLAERGYGIDADQGLPLTTLRSEGAEAQAGMVVYAQPSSSDNVNLNWESAGVTQVEDRLMLTVTISWGEETPGTFDDTEGDVAFINPQVTLIESSGPALAR